MTREKLTRRRENNVITRQEAKSANKKIFTATNKVFISGKIEAEFEYSHQVLWEKFYRTRVRVERLSGTEDFIPIIVSELLIEEWMNHSIEGKWVEIAGRFQSYNKIGEDGKKHLDLNLFVMSIKIYDNEYELEETKNSSMIYLDGYLCKQPVFRETPLGRQITDLLIAVNRPYKKSDYIPSIAWGRVARWASDLEVGSRVRLYGKIQSRKYLKRFPDSEYGEYREAYEVSIMRMKRVKE